MHDAAPSCRDDEEVGSCPGPGKMAPSTSLVTCWLPPMPGPFFWPSRDSGPALLPGGPPSTLPRVLTTRDGSFCPVVR
ncbi:hypothetical protein D187_004581 [Cystobacter fuscus DSM 2262]|uniref:Uncharacterized protein n=1 Tax=Cystobacter fuscus (strain ATCC 25194 / DSM 2262 / NBRC 100088 / M29) TaxID=1242864 RepID=S9PPU1_CYSF2|nr:hypothetical protein D187_004581 [Cystobacter fuscus DSM 2262]